MCPNYFSCLISLADSEITVTARHTKAFQDLYKNSDGTYLWLSKNMTPPAERSEKLTKQVNNMLEDANAIIPFNALFTDRQFYINDLSFMTKEQYSL